MHPNYFGTRYCDQGNKKITAVRVPSIYFDRVSYNKWHTWTEHDLHTLDRNLPLCYIAQDPYSTDSTQETCPRSCRSCRLYGCHSATWATVVDYTDQENICPKWNILVMKVGDRWSARGVNNINSTRVISIPFACRTYNTQLRVLCGSDANSISCHSGVCGLPNSVGLKNIQVSLWNRRTPQLKADPTQKKIG